MRSQESCRYDRKVQVRLSNSMKQLSTGYSDTEDTACPVMNVQARVQSDRSCVNKIGNILSAVRMKVNGSSSISSTLYNLPLYQCAPGM